MHHSNDLSIRLRIPVNLPVTAPYSVFIKGHLSTNHRLSNLQARVLQESSSKPTPGTAHPPKLAGDTGKVKHPRPMEGAHTPISSRLGVAQMHTSNHWPHLHTGTEGCWGDLHS